MTRLFPCASQEVTVVTPVPFRAVSGVRYALLVQVNGTTFTASAWPAENAQPVIWKLRASDPSASWLSGYGGLRMYYLSPGSTMTTVALFQEASPP